MSDFTIFLISNNQTHSKRRHPSQHNSTKQKLSTIRLNTHSITSRIKTEDDINLKIDLLADVANQMMVASERLGELSTNVKNVVVANALLAENIEAVITRQFKKRVISYLP